ncbi:hypothetical protein JD969_01435 [Planctomycetota bacterium]|nr:hypothetical protein JD969_01435 [Planctomycetota bacterium]
MRCQLSMKILLVVSVAGIAMLTGCASKGQEHNYKELNRDRPRFETEPEYNTYQHYGFADPKISFYMLAQYAVMQEEQSQSERPPDERSAGEGGEEVVGESEAVGGETGAGTEGEGPTGFNVPEHTPHKPEADRLGIPSQSRVVGKRGEAEQNNEETGANAAPEVQPGEISEGAGQKRGVWGQFDRWFNLNRLGQDTEQDEQRLRRDEVQTQPEQTKRELETLEGVVPGEEEPAQDQIVPHGSRVIQEQWALPRKGPMEDWTQETNRGTQWAQESQRIAEGANLEADKNAGYAPTPPELDETNREKIIEFEDRAAEGIINPEEDPYFDNKQQPINVLEDDTAKTVKLTEPSGTNFPGDTSGTDILWPKELDANMRRLRRENWPRIQFAPVDGRTVHLPTYRFGQIPLGADNRDPLDAESVPEQMALAMNEYQMQGWNDLNWQNMPASFFRFLSIVGTMPIRGLAINSPFDHVRTAKISYQESSESPKAVLFDPQDFSNTLPGATVLKKGDIDNPTDPLVPLNETYISEQMIPMGPVGEMERFGTEEESAKELENEDGIGF